MILKDILGIPYEIELLDIQLLEDKFFDKSIYYVIRLALGVFVPGVKSGVVYFDLSDGSFIPLGLTAGDGLIKSAHLVKIYEIPADFEALWFSVGLEEFFNSEDLEKLREKLKELGHSEEEVEEKITSLSVKQVSKILNMSDEEFRERLVYYLGSFVDMTDLWEEVERKYRKLVKTWQINKNYYR